MDRWAVSLSGPDTAVNGPFQHFQACMHGKGGDVGLHAREGGGRACMRARRARRARRSRLARPARWFNE